MKSDNGFEQKAKVVRKWCLISTTEAGSGHPSSCLSAADLATVLFDTYFRYDLKNPLNPTNDRFILSKGHAAPLLYTLFAMSGAFPLEELRTLRKIDSPLEGHPTPEFSYTDAATGSLGQGLSVGAGLAYVAKRENLGFRSFVVTGDGELAEGQVWEAANFASYYKLNNLIVIADINRLGQSQETMFGHHIDEYVGRFRSFGFEVIAIDGHDYKAINAAFHGAVNNTTEKPYAIIAKTFKGHGISFLADKDGSHGKPLKKEDLEKALKELGEVDDKLRFSLNKPTTGPAARSSHSARSSEAFIGFSNQGKLQHTLLLGSPQLASPVATQYKLGEKIGTRDVYGTILGELGNADPTIYALDGDVKNSTYSQDFKKAHQDRFIECFIAEQNMVGVAVGLSRIGKKPFVSTFAAFLTRAFDQIRMAAIGKANIKFVGSHAGVSIGEDGPSQMGLEDIAIFGAIPDSVILHPSDAVATAKLLPYMVNHVGISYLRTLRPKTPVIYDVDESFEFGGSKTLRTKQSAKGDDLTVVATGITVHEALKAYEELKREGISVRVIDCYSIKPIDKDTLKRAIKETKKPIIITVEDHFEHGGLGDFVQSALSDTQARIEKMAVSHISHSGKPDELLMDAGISSMDIVEKVRKLLH